MRCKIGFLNGVGFEIEDSQMSGISLIMRLLGEIAQKERDSKLGVLLSFVEHLVGHKRQVFQQN